MRFTTSIHQSPILKEGSIEGAPETLGTQLRRQVGLRAPKGVPRVQFGPLKTKQGREEEEEEQEQQQ